MSNPQHRPTTTDAGIPVASDEHSLTIGPDGPILLQDHYLIEQMANFNRERIPERQPHAKGSGAFGRFEVTNDVSSYTRAAVFAPGATTDTLIRFRPWPASAARPTPGATARVLPAVLHLRGQPGHRRQQHPDLLPV
jgi:catalase